MFLNKQGNDNKQENGCRRSSHMHRFIRIFINADSFSFLRSYFPTFKFFHTIQSIMTVITKGDKVLVSGANGYIAMWTVRLLLERGYSVRGTVRDASKVDFMKKYFESLGFGDKFEVVIVPDIVKASLEYLVVLESQSQMMYRKVHSMRPSRT